MLPYWRISRENSREISRQNLIWLFSSIIIKFRYFLSSVLSERFLKSQPPIFLHGKKLLTGGAFEVEDWFDK